MQGEGTSRTKATQKPRKRVWTKRLAWTSAVAAVVAGLVVMARPRPLEVETAVARRGLLSVTVNEDGQSRVRDRFVISAPLAGKVARTELRAGDPVKQGDVVARILPLPAPLLDARSRSEAEARVSATLAGRSQAQAQVERALVARDYAVKEADNVRRLEARGTISKQQLDQALLDQRARSAELTSAQFAAKVAAHEFSMAQAALGRLGSKGDTEQLDVTSPVSGRVLQIFQQSEGVVAPGSQLLEVGDPAALEVVVDVLTSDAVSIASGARVALEEWGGAPLSGTVRLVEPSAFTRLSALGVEEQRVNAVIDVTSPYTEWKALGDGYRVLAKIEVYREERALLIPWSALFRSDGAWAVFILEGGVAKLRRLDIGRRGELHAEVKGGLEEGARVILHPSDRITDGSAVTPSQ